MDYNQNDMNGGYPQQGQPDQPYSGAPQQPNFGAPQPSYGGAPQGGESKGMAIASMVCGIVSIVICCCEYVSIPLGIIAVVLGVLSIKKGEGGRGMAIAGIVCGGVSLAFILVCEILVRSGVIETDPTQWEEFLEKYKDQMGQSA